MPAMWSHLNTHLANETYRKYGDALHGELIFGGSMRKFCYFPFLAFGNNRDPYWVNTFLLNPIPMAGIAPYTEVQMSSIFYSHITRSGRLIIPLQWCTTLVAKIGIGLSIYPAGFADHIS
jgi:hypothetical protein